MRGLEIIELALKRVLDGNALPIPTHKQGILPERGEDVDSHHRAKIRKDVVPDVIEQRIEKLLAADQM